MGKPTISMENPPFPWPFLMQPAGDTNRFSSQPRPRGAR
jgi:hypothetical protein